MEDPTGQWAAAAYAAYCAACEMGRPSTVHRPMLKRDGNKWHALYGGEFPEGVSGFGDSPEEAYRDFDRAWFKKIEEGAPSD